MVDDTITSASCRYIVTLPLAMNSEKHVALYTAMKLAASQALDEVFTLLTTLEIWIEDDAPTERIIIVQVAHSITQAAGIGLYKWIEVGPPRRHDGYISLKELLETLQSFRRQRATF